ncbi:histidine-containing phosphotransfer protein [Vigna angularis]|uniref:Histidine-containing phosphotransfer protein n=1 Tax=Phaseolus angularis TaxID=3914 RepID=A0A8T0JSE9_PHAAN|nr:histidine-containing phosphotransfer protein [Vigna angularis]
MSSTERVGGFLVSIGIDRRTSMDREFSDYNKKGNHFNQFMGSSSTIGAKTVRNVCVAFRAAAEQNNRAGWVPFCKLFQSLFPLISWNFFTL